jgi:hypothetical protein
LRKVFIGVIKVNFMKKTLGLILAGCLAYTSMVHCQDKKEGALRGNEFQNSFLFEKADLLRKSAEKSRNAAITLQAQAAKNRQVASNYENAGLGANPDRRDDYKAAGNLLVRAGDLEISAARNYSTAYSNLNSAVSIYDMVQFRDLEKLEKLAESDDLNVNKCYYQALKDFAGAESAFSEFYGNDLEQQALVNEKSAKCLETIAGRK